MDLEEEQVETGCNRRGKVKFSAEEDALIIKLVKKFGEKAWSSVAARIPNRTARQIRERYKNYLSPDVNNSPWTAEEDARLLMLVAEHGPKWSKIMAHFRNRTDVSIKNHYILIQRREARLRRKATAAFCSKARQILRKKSIEPLASLLLSKKLSPRRRNGSAVIDQGSLNMPTSLEGQASETQDVHAGDCYSPVDEDNYPLSMAGDCLADDFDMADFFEDSSWI